MEGKVGLIFILSLLAAMLERLAENLGFFIHSDGFRHSYSFIGYFSFLFFLLFFYSLTVGESK
jgi:hypothetical protein